MTNRPLRRFAERATAGPRPRSAGRLAAAVLASALLALLPGFPDSGTARLAAAQAPSARRDMAADQH